MDKKFIPVVSTAVLAATLIFVGYQVRIPYKQQLASQQGITNTISVAGEGKFSIAPDTFLININVSEVAKTTKEAQDKADKKIEAIKAILKDFDIKKEQIQTTNLSVSTEYEWTDSQRKLVGYRSQQTINIKVQGENFSSKGADIVSKISEIGEINIENSQFTIDNKDAAAEKAREKAFENAKNKAEQLAKLGGVNLGKPTMIVDQNIQYYENRPVYELAMMKDAVANAGAGQATNTNTLSPGQVDITANIQVTYEIK